MPKVSNNLTISTEFGSDPGDDPEFDNIGPVPGHRVESIRCTEKEFLWFFNKIAP